jgi:hypothetical protein
VRGEGRVGGRAIGAAAVLLCALAILAAGVPVAFATGVTQSKSFSELTSGGSGSEEAAPTKTATTATTARTGTETNTNSQTLILVAIGAAVLLLSAIGLVIVRDARRVAPAVDGEIAEARTGHNPAALARRRAKAKAARRQRKRNR